MDFEGEFDAAFSNAALALDARQGAVAASIDRALKPGGRFAGEMGGEGNLARLREALDSELIIRGYSPPPTELSWYASAEDFADLYEDAGFDEIDARLIDRPTKIEHGIAAWVTTFRRGWLDRAGVPEDERAEIGAAVAERFGSDVADYVRLRFIMRKPLLTKCVTCRLAIRPWRDARRNRRDVDRRSVRRRSGRGPARRPDRRPAPPRVRAFGRAPIGRDGGKNMVAGQVPFFLGCGAYRHHIPASVDHIIQRGEFLTSYTPYQPEIAQGTLQVLFEFQTQVARLFGCDVANASMYDGSTACWEAIQMAGRITRRKKAILSSGLHPHYVSVARPWRASPATGWRRPSRSWLPKPTPSG
jgi:hypothetical protein